MCNRGKDNTIEWDLSYLLFRAWKDGWKNQLVNQQNITNIYKLLLYTVQNDWDILMMLMTIL